MHASCNCSMIHKAWKKRVNHPFTAHLQRRNVEAQKQNADAEDEKLDRSTIFPEDYTEADIESDADSEYRQASSQDPSQKSKSGKSNEALTKKKYCQSTRMYFDMFDSDAEAEYLSTLVKNCRKYIFQIIFSLFRDNLPSECEHRLPVELWEKIWRMTQTPFSFNQTETFLAGVRSKYGHPKYQALEFERLTDLFAAVGNLHMIVFEVLFKHPKIATAPPFIAMEFVEAKQLYDMPYCKAVFQKYMKQAVIAFDRLKKLEVLELKQKAAKYRDMQERLTSQTAASISAMMLKEAVVDVAADDGKDLEGDIESEADAVEEGSGGTGEGATLLGRGFGECDGESMASANTVHSSLTPCGSNKKSASFSFNCSAPGSSGAGSSDVIYKIERGIYEVINC